MLTFQDIISRLNVFWEKQGCIIHQGYDLEVGAGTFNPATFLRCLGPEPYNTAYVEPSRRPTDARYAENPNRMHLFHQYQVILKPSPADVQRTYLHSLAFLGLDLKKHDIRFVHDDWESPTLGAWGLGWEVWCDGMEITQFTYFQAIGSTLLHPIPAEITYGLERLALFIQNKQSIFDVKWNKALSFGDIAKQSEVEWSIYNFEAASTSMWMRHFEDYEREANALISRNLPIPAYDFVLKASHAFNMLDARGAISVTERTGYIARIRDLARLVASEYVASREKLGFALCQAAEKRKNGKASSFLKAIPKFSPDKTQDFLFEIGSEQLPATFIPIGCQNLEKHIRNLLEKQGLSFASLKVFGTPQRLAVLVTGLVEGTAQRQIVKRGPPVHTAFDNAGVLTEQGKGFLKSLSLPYASLEEIRKASVKNLAIDTIKETQYLFAHLTEPGRSTFATLAEDLPKIIDALEFPKKMRWASLDISYARPIHWIVALFGEKIIPLRYGDVLSGRDSFGHAQLKPKKITLKQPKDYVRALKKQRVLVDSKERTESILKQIKAIEKKIKGSALEQQRVLSQVVYLTEWPQLTYAHFDSAFLRAPKEVLISEMVEHQKYFPIADAKNNLKNFFIITADTLPNETIRRGNQKVLSARLTDGVFLYEQDLKSPLGSFNEKLKEMTYHKELGSMFEKVMRLIALAQLINSHLAIADAEKVQRAALLSKADLASLLVGEFPELQGTIGKYYALAHKEDKEVALAIQEQWMPRFENAPLPSSATGTILSLADKFDNLISCYSIGLKPSSSSDPYALRRQAIGVLKILIECKKSFNLRKVVQECCMHFPHIASRKEVILQLTEEILAFFTARAKGVFEEYGFKKDESEAVLQGICTDPFDQFCKIKSLHAFRKSPEFPKLLEVYKRARGQLEKSAPLPFNPQLATQPAERALIDSLEQLNKRWQSTVSDKNYTEAFAQLCKLHPPLAQLFENVKILVEDPPLRANRIALLQKVLVPFQDLLNFSALQENSS